MHRLKNLLRVENIETIVLGGPSLYLFFELIVYVNAVDNEPAKYDSATFWVVFATLIAALFYVWVLRQPGLPDRLPLFFLSLFAGACVACVWMWFVGDNSQLTLVGVRLFWVEAVVATLFVALAFCRTVVPLLRAERAQLKAMQEM